MQPKKVKVNKVSSKNFHRNSLIIIGVITVTVILVIILFLNSLFNFKRELGKLGNNSTSTHLIRIV